MRKFLSTYWFLFLIAGIIIVSDQITKQIVRTNLEIGQTWMPLEWLAPYARFINWHNTGVAFVMFQGMGWVFAILAAIVSVGLIIYYPRLHQGSWLIRLAMGLMLGGAVGNLIDRIYQGFVTDFISLGSFPVFNVADGSITVGVIVLILGMWRTEQKEKQRQIDQLAASTPDKLEADCAQPPNQYE